MILEDRAYSLVTNVLDEKHLRVLQDWLDFFDWPPVEIVAIVGNRGRTKASLGAFCNARKLKLRVVGYAAAKELKENEPSYMRASLQAVRTGTAVQVHLDTLPYRVDGHAWQERALELVRNSGAIYITGSTRAYRLDWGAEDPDFLFTRRLSNNFLMMSPVEWLHIQDERHSEVERFGRFSTESAIEGYCAETGRFGLRIRNGAEMRIFHTQEWGARMYEIRRRMHLGQGIGPFIDGFQDDVTEPWDEFYEYPRPSRLALAFARVRRTLKEFAR